MDQDAAREDIASTRRTIEQGRRVACAWSPDMLVWGVAVAIGYFGTYARVRGLVRIEPNWLWLPRLPIALAHTPRPHPRPPPPAANAGRGRAFIRLAARHAVAWLRHFPHHPELRADRRGRAQHVVDEPGRRRRDGGRLLRQLVSEQRGVAALGRDRLVGGRACRHRVAPAPRGPAARGRADARPPGD